MGLTNIDFYYCFLYSFAMANYCSECGNKVSQEFSYCPYCGQRLDKKIIITTTPLPTVKSIKEPSSKPIKEEQSPQPVKVDKAVLAERLRAYRLFKANEQGWSAFCVFSDKTLLSIIDVLPTKLSDFNKVKGNFYGKKIEKYGKDIIKIIVELNQNI